MYGSVRSVEAMWEMGEAVKKMGDSEYEVAIAKISIKIGGKL